MKYNAKRVLAMMLALILALPSFGLAEGVGGLEPPVDEVSGLSLGAEAPRGAEVPQGLTVHYDDARDVEQPEDSTSNVGEVVGRGRRSTSLKQ